MSPAKEQVIVEEKNCPISSDRMLKKQIRGATSVHNWKEGGRRDNKVVASSLENDDSRYVRLNHEDSPSSMFQFLAGPFLWGALQVRMVL